MAESIKSKTASKTGASTLEFDDFELQATMQNFLKEEEKETGKGIWNFATISGMVMLFMGLSFMMSWIGLPIGQGLGAFATDAIAALPLIGGALVTLIGFGFFVGDRRREKRAAKKERRRRRQQSKSSNKDMNDVHGAETMGSYSRLKNNLDSDFKSSSKASGSYSFEDYSMDSYGYRHQKKLLKSRSDKKWAGVCGGLAKYFGISSTVVRFIFVAAFFMGYGASLLIYFGLSLAMPKEPVELMDDFDF